MNIAIIGAGIMGRTLAYILAEQHFNIDLYEKNSFQHPTNCSFSAAGMLSPFAELSSAIPSVVDVGLQSIRKWKTITSQLRKNVFFDESGTLCLAHPENQSYLNRFIEVLKQKNCYQNSMRIKTKDYEPELNSILDEAIYLKNEAQVDAKMLMHAIGHDLCEYKVAIHSHALIDEINEKEILVKGMKKKFDWVIDCRGLGAKTKFKDLRGVRGELIHLRAPQVKIKHVIRIFHPHFPIYIIPRPQHQYIIGASCIDSEDRAPLSVRTALELLSTAYSVHLGIGEAHIIKTVTHCRPAFDTNLPKIFIDSKKRVISINGLYRYGFLFAPFFATRILDFFVHDTWNPDCHLFLNSMS